MLISCRTTHPLHQAGTDPFLQNAGGADRAVQKLLLQVALSGKAGHDDQPAGVVGKIDTVVPVGEVQD